MAPGAVADPPPGGGTIGTQAVVTFVSTGILGSGQVGSGLAAQSTTSPADAQKSYQWQRNGQPIGGATGVVYEPVVADYGQAITVVITATAPGYDPGTATAGPVTIQAGQASVGSFSIQGTAQVGQTLSVAQAPTITPANATVSYQWLRAGAAITGATSSSYVVQPADAGLQVALKITATAAYYASGSRTSSGLLIPGTCQLTEVTILGHAVVGNTITAKRTVTPSSATVAYQWVREDGPIAGATEQTYRLVAGDLGHNIRVQMTATATGWQPGQADSEWLLGIGAGDFQVVSASILGDVRVGSTVAISMVSNPGADSHTYQWKVDGVAVGTDVVYTPTQDQINKSLTVTVTFVKQGYNTQSATSVARTIGGAAGSTQINWVAAPSGSINLKVGAAVSLTALQAQAADGAQLIYSASGLPSGLILGGLTGQFSGSPSVDGTFQVVVTANAVVNPGNYVPAQRTFTLVVAKGTLVGTQPVLSGTAQVGQTLTLSGPLVTPAGASLTYVWYRNTSVIVGASGTTYVLQNADVGKDISVKVTATKAGYNSLVKYSSHVIVFGVSKAQVTGTLQVGYTLSLAVEFAPSTAVAEVQWFRGTSAIPGAKSLTYTLVAADSGADISAKVTLSAPGFTSVVKYSNHVQVQVAGLGIQSVVVSGTAQVGSTLTSVVGFTPLDAVLSYQWYRGTSAISAGRSASYTLVAADAGADLVLKVTATKNGASVVKYSNHVLVPVGLVVSQPSIPPGRDLNALLTVSVSVSPATATVSYQWFADGVAVPGATGVSFRPAGTAYDVVCKVTVSAPGLTSVVKYSNHSFPYTVY
jgi:hypothetical protein